MSLGFFFLEVVIASFFAAGAASSSFVSWDSSDESAFFATSSDSPTFSVSRTFKLFSPLTLSYSPGRFLKNRIAEGSTETMSPGAKRVFALLCFEKTILELSLYI